MWYIRKLSETNVIVLPVMCIVYLDLNIQIYQLDGYLELLDFVILCCTTTECDDNGEGFLAYLPTALERIYFLQIFCALVRNLLKGKKPPKGNNWINIRRKIRSSEIMYGSCRHILSIRRLQVCSDRIQRGGCVIGLFDVENRCRTATECKELRITVSAMFITYPEENCFCLFCGIWYQNFEQQYRFQNWPQNLWKRKPREMIYNCSPN